RQGTEPRGKAPGAWGHGAGRSCEALIDYFPASTWFMLLFVALSPHIVINSDVRLRSRRGNEMGNPAAAIAAKPVGVPVRDLTLRSARTGRTWLSGPARSSTRAGPRMSRHRRESRPGRDRAAGAR